MREALEMDFFILELNKYVRKFIASCSKCILKKKTQPDGLLQNILKGHLPLSVFRLDHLEPMEIPAKKYKFLLAVIDGYAFKGNLWSLLPKHTVHSGFTASISTVQCSGHFHINKVYWNIFWIHNYGLLTANFVMFWT